MDCFERFLILDYIGGNLETELYRVQQPIRLIIRNRPWSVLSPSGRALNFLLHILSLNYHAVLRLLICLFFVNWPEEARVRYLETRGALNSRSIQGISQFFLVIQSVHIRNSSSSVSFQINHLTAESNSPFNSDNTLF